MIRELSCKLIYDEFVVKEKLTSEEIKILDMMLNHYTIVKISHLSCMSTAVVSRYIRKIKDKYNDYKKIELSKLEIFDKN